MRGPPIPPAGAGLRVSRVPIRKRKGAGKRDGKQTRTPTEEELCLAIPIIFDDEFAASLDLPAGIGSLGSFDFETMNLDEILKDLSLPIELSEEELTEAMAALEVRASEEQVAFAEAVEASPVVAAVAEPAANGMEDAPLEPSPVVYDGPVRRLHFDDFLRLREQVDANRVSLTRKQVVSLMDIIIETRVEGQVATRLLRSRRKEVQTFLRVSPEGMLAEDGNAPAMRECFMQPTSGASHASALALPKWQSASEV
ncbi:hypothetical protein N2152v2_002222 [Parachlorella kessleri]